MQRTSELRELFLTQGKVSKKHTDRSCTSVHEQFCQTLDRIMQNRAEHEVFPRMSSQAANDRIERLVRGLEENAELANFPSEAPTTTTPTSTVAPKDDETIIEPPKLASPARPNKKVGEFLLKRAHARVCVCNKSVRAPPQQKNKDNMNRLTDAPDFEETPNDRDGLSGEQKEGDDEHNSINLDDDSDKARQYDEDEEGEDDENGEKWWTSDSGEYSDDGEVSDGEAVQAANGGGSGEGADESSDEDFDGNDADDDEPETQAPPAKKAKTATKAPAPKPKESPAKPKAVDENGVTPAGGVHVKQTTKAKKPSVTPKKAGNKEMAAFKKQQAELKRKRTADTKDVEATEKVMNDFIYVAAIQSMQVERNFRKILLSASPPSTNAEIVRITHSLQAVEAQVAESLLLANKATPEKMREITDFVKGATELRDGSEAHAKAAQRCDITHATATAECKLICIEACHMTKKDGALVALWKRKVVREDLRDLIEAVWFAVNLLALTESMVAEHLLRMKSFENGKTMAAEAIRLIQTEASEKKRLRSVLRKKLSAALGKIDLSTKILEK